MLRFVAIVLVLCGLGLLGAGWSLHDDYRVVGYQIAWLEENPEELPTLGFGETREEYLQSLRAGIGPLQRQAMLAGGGGLVLLIAGIVLFVRIPRRKPATDPWPALDEDAFTRWRDESLRSPLVVQPRRSIVVLRHFVVGLFVLMAAGVVASQPLAPTTVGIGALCLGLAGVLFALFRNVGRRTVVRLDHEGVTRGDGRRLAWQNLLGLEYQLALSRRQRHEALWRITLHFAADEAWVVPAQTANLDQVLSLLEAMPVPKRQKPV